MNTSLPAEKPVLELFLLALFGSLHRKGDSMHRLSSNLAGRRWPAISYSLRKLKIWGSFGEFRPPKKQKTA